MFLVFIFICSHHHIVDGVSTLPIAEQFLFISKEPIDIINGIQDHQAQTMAKNLGFTGAKKDVASEQIKRLYELFVNVDATQVEINPFGETPDGRGSVQLQQPSIS